MIQWKNRPIDQLNETELRRALNEAVALAVAKNATPEHQILDSFWLGLLIGAGASLIALLLASIII